MRMNTQALDGLDVGAGRDLIDGDGDPELRIGAEVLDVLVGSSPRSCR